jgi:hypothetical protein
MVVTVRSMKNNFFDCNGGLHCACNSYGLGSDWDYGRVLVNRSVCDASVDCNYRTSDPMTPLRGEYDGERQRQRHGGEDDGLLGDSD